MPGIIGLLPTPLLVIQGAWDLVPLPPEPRFTKSRSDTKVNLVQ